MIMMIVWHHRVGWNRKHTTVVIAAGGSPVEGNGILTYGCTVPQTKTWHGRIA